MFGTWGSQVQILPLRPVLSLSQTGRPDSFPDSYRIFHTPTMKSAGYATDARSATT
jgi:hypothetical protein